MDITFRVTEIKEFRPHTEINSTFSKKLPGWDKIITSDLLHVSATMVIMMTVILPPSPPPQRTTTKTRRRSVKVYVLLE